MTQTSKTREYKDIKKKIEGVFKEYPNIRVDEFRYVIEDLIDLFFETLLNCRK